MTTLVDRLRRFNAAGGYVPDEWNSVSSYFNESADRLEKLEKALHRIGYEPLARETMIAIARRALEGK